MIENLYSRIAELEQALRDVRESAAYNLEEPGNEDDTLNYVVDRVNGMLHDNYVYTPSED